MRVRFAAKIVGLLTVAALLCACDNSSSGATPIEPVASMPDEFVDTLGGTWLCEQPQHDSQISGTVSLQNPPSSPQNADILHIALFAQDPDGNLQSLSSYCINNISRFPIAFALPYDSSLINQQNTYGISANYFERIDGNLYDASHKRDGLKPVINNGVTTQVDIVLPASN